MKGESIVICQIGKTGNRTGLGGKNKKLCFVMVSLKNLIYIPVNMYIWSLVG